MLGEIVIKASSKAWSFFMGRLSGNRRKQSIEKYENHYWHLAIMMLSTDKQ